MNAILNALIAGFLKNPAAYLAPLRALLDKIAEQPDPWIALMPEGAWKEWAKKNPNSALKVVSEILGVISANPDVLPLIVALAGKK